MHSVPVINHGRQRHLAREEMQRGLACVRVVCVLPQLAYCSRAVCDLLATEMIDGARASSEGNSGQMWWSSRSAKSGDNGTGTLSSELTRKRSGFGTGGLRSGAGQFYPELAEVSAALGATHFAVVDATAGSDGTIRGLTALVLLRAPQLR